MLTKIKDANGNEFKVHGYGLKALNQALKEARFDGELGTGEMTVNEAATMKLYLARVAGFRSPHVRKHRGIVQGFIRFLGDALKAGKSLIVESNKKKEDSQE
jgi:hypothetical protein